MLGRLAYAALFLVSLQSAAFFIGEADAEGRIPVLCEDAPEVFVSTPAGNTVLLELAGHQAVFSPAFPGPYIVQCGNETKEVAVQGSSEAQGGLPGRGDSYLPYFVLGGVLLAAASALLFAKHLLADSAAFSKTVEGGRARLEIRAGKRLDEVRVSDPVFAGFEGKWKEILIPSIGAGKAWVMEYEISEPERALPASLEARCEGARISMLSGLLIAGKRKGTGATGGPEKGSGKGGDRDGSAAAGGKAPDTLERRLLPKAGN